MQPPTPPHPPKINKVGFFLNLYFFSVKLKVLDDFILSINKVECTQIDHIS